MNLPEAMDASVLARAERAGINLRRPYQVEQLPSGALQFAQETSPSSDRPESKGRTLWVVLAGWSLARKAAK